MSRVITLVFVFDGSEWAGDDGGTPCWCEALPGNRRCGVCWVDDHIGGSFLDIGEFLAALGVATPTGPVRVVLEGAMRGEGPTPNPGAWHGWDDYEEWFDGTVVSVGPDNAPAEERK